MRTVIYHCPHCNAIHDKSVNGSFTIKSPIIDCDSCHKVFFMRDRNEWEFISSTRRFFFKLGWSRKRDIVGGIISIIVLL
jgi:hypothetical protein